MNFRRQGISPVLATVMLIAITLIAAVAIAGFVFNLFGTFQNGPRLQVVNAACDPATCSLQVTNTGTANGFIMWASSGYVMNGTQSIPSNSQRVTIRLAIQNPPVLGQTISGYVTTGQGVQLSFTATVTP